MKMKKAMVSVMTAVLLTALLAGCSGGQTSGNTGSTAPVQQAAPSAPAETTAPAAEPAEAPAAETASAESKSEVIVMPAPAPEAPAAAPETAPAQSAAASGPITAEQAKQAALQHAGLTESQVVFARTELDFEHGRQIYEVEFYSGQTEYDYDIDAATGDILSFDQDAEYIVPATPEAAAATSAIVPEQSAAATGPITEEQAKQIALQHAGLTESQVVFARTQLDYEHGRQEYEIEFYSGTTEYDYDIDAATGDIISFDQDAEFIAPVTPASAAPAAPAAAPAQGSGPITKDQALQIALQHAGVSQSDISRERVKQDYDDGRQKFEVSFHVGWKEYEYDIDAATGRILEFDVDND